MRSFLSSKPLWLALVLLLAGLPRFDSSTKAGNPGAPPIPQGKHSPANSDPVYLQLRAAKISGGHASAENFLLKRETATIVFKRGDFHFLSPVGGVVTGAVFLGEGEFQMDPGLPYEQRYLSILTGTPSISEQFNKMVLRFTDATYEEIKKQCRVMPGAPSSEAQSALDNNRKMLRKGKHFSQPNVAAALLNYNLDGRILMDLTWPGRAGLFEAYFEGKRYGDMLYGIDPLGAPFVTPEEVVLASLSDSTLGIWTASHLQAHYAAGAVSNENHQLIDLQHYKIEAAMKGKSLDAMAEVKFKATVDGPRVVPFDLFPKLRMRKVTDSQGHELSFIQEDKDEDADFFVVLQEGMRKDQEYVIGFEYNGDGAVSDSGGGNFTLDARTNWYPNSVFGDRATYELTLRVPKDLTMVATGHPFGETHEGDQLVSRWKSDVPIAVAGFNYGRFKKSAVEDEKSKYVIESYANKDIPDSLKEIQRAAEALRAQVTLGSLNTISMMDKARAEAQLSIGLYSNLFGPLPYGRIAMTQQPYFSFGQAWPMLVYMPIVAFLDSTFRQQLGMRSGDTFFKIVSAHEVAHQWWGHLVGWKSYRDQWMSEGFAHCSASIFARALYKDDLFLKFWKEQREQMLEKNTKGKRPSDVGGVYMGYRLDNPKTGYVTTSMIYPKGAFILHMLRMLMWDPKSGDTTFVEMMKDFVKTHYNQNVSTEDFQRVVEKHMTGPMDLAGNRKMDWFFKEWVYGTSIPDYKLDYKLEPAEQGKTKLTVKVTQSNVDDSFVMRVPIYMDLEGKIARIGSLALVGNSTAPPGEVLLPVKPKRIMLCSMEDVLCTTRDR